MRRWCDRLGLLVGLVVLAGCGGNDGGGGGTADVDSLNVGAGQNRTLDTTRLNVAQDAVVDGTLTAADGRMVLNVGGDLTVNGTLAADDPDDTVPNDTDLLGNLPGITLIVAGDVTFGPNAVINSDGVVILTDDETQLTRTIDDENDEAESASGNLPTLVPLPPEDPAFGRGESVDETPLETRQAARNVTVGGTWTIGPAPGVYYRFFGSPVNFNLNNWTLNVNGPPAPAPQGSADNPSPSGNGGNGRNGGNLNIWNNSGPINIVGIVTLNLPNGQDGQTVTTACTAATGGNGGKPGNLRMTASGGIDLSSGTLVINPGAGGNGGNANNTGTAGAAGCPGADGCDATATGGNGGENRKRLLVRGNVAGVANISVATVVGGDGGAATAVGGAGGNGNECCDGGNGGDGTATGGRGGDAAVNVGGLAVTAAGARGGDGGDGTATGGVGGNGGDCKLAPAGDGGDGGDATATGGAGGDATASAGTATGGDGGDGTATAGSGGTGGDSAVLPGGGGDPGDRTANGGAGGTPDGAAGDETETDGLPGADGGDIQLRILFCFDFGFLTTSSVPPGDYTATLTDEAGQQNLGTMPLNLAPGGEFASSDQPVHHFGMFGPSTMTLITGQISPPASAPIAGLRLEPLFGQNINQSNPLLLTAMDPFGLPISTAHVLSLPNNQGDPNNPESVDVIFENPESKVIDRIVVNAPSGSFVTFIRICLIDP